MPVMSILPQGGTIYSPHSGGTHQRAARQEIKGWSTASIGRLKKWLLSVDPEQLTGDGYALTLTMRDTPTDVKDWVKLKHNFFQALTRLEGYQRHLWVVEWQSRGTPHIHVTIYGGADIGESAIKVWQRMTESLYGSQIRGQFVTKLYDANGWLNYCQKHYSKGAANYQRAQMITGWEKSGRMWGYGGDWPCMDPLLANLGYKQHVVIKRLAKRTRASRAAYLAKFDQSRRDYHMNQYRYWSKNHEHVQFDPQHPSKVKYLSRVFGFTHSWNESQAREVLGWVQSNIDVNEKCQSMQLP